MISSVAKLLAVFIQNEEQLLRLHFGQKYHVNNKIFGTKTWFLNNGNNFEDGYVKWVYVQWSLMHSRLKRQCI